MGNKKNRRNREFSKHRHVFVKRKLPGARQKQKAPKEIKQKHTDTERDIHKEDIVTKKGSRMINLEKLQDSLTTHSSTCQGTIILTGEWPSVHSYWTVYSLLPYHQVADIKESEGPSRL